MQFPISVGHSSPTNKKKKNTEIETEKLFWGYYEMPKNPIAKKGI
jgi:hypothetical protein